jgi:hypothetical protein
MDRLIQYYGIEGKISGHVEWKRYALLLDLADELSFRLREYGPNDMISIQSYMWVVSELIKKNKVGDIAYTETFDYQGELDRRQRSASEQERIGLKGERYIVDEEKERLRGSGKMDLATKVRLVSADPGLGYDVLSFELDGEEIHIEVKTTSRSREGDVGFYLSDYEKSVAEEDQYWRIYRVWEIDVAPEVEDLGNLIAHPKSEWTVETSTWKVRHADQSRDDNG